VFFINSFLLPNITTDPNILARVLKFVDDRQPKFKVISLRVFALIGIEHKEKEK
jgi:hypothetical protein